LYLEKKERKRATNFAGRKHTLLHFSIFENSSSFVQNTPPKNARKYYGHFLVELAGVAPASKRQKHYRLQAYQRLEF